MMARWTGAQARAEIARAPPISLQKLTGGGPVAVVAPHPDDESLGCGGLIALCSAAAIPLLTVVLTDGAASHPHSRSHPAARLAALRREESAAAADALGALAPVFLGAPDGRLGEAAEGVGDRLRRLLAEHRPTLVCAPWRADPHPDHKAAHDLAAAAAAAIGARLACYPVWGLTLPDGDDAGPALRGVTLDVARVLDRKRAAILAHRSQTSGLIEDDPEGFRLTAADLARHLGPREPYLLAD